MGKGIGTFLKGALFGAIAGATAGILFAPQSGKETREQIKKKAEEMKNDAVKLYEDGKKMLDRKVTELKKLGKKIDEGKYKELVNDVLEDLKSNSGLTAEAAKRLGKQLQSDWEKVKKAVAA